MAFALTLGGLCVFLVVTARRAITVQERLKNAEQVAHLREKAEKILESAPVGVLALDELERVSGCNRAFRERIAPAGIGHQMTDAFPEAGPEAIQALVRLVSSARSSPPVGAVPGRPGTQLHGGESSAP